MRRARAMVTVTLLALAACSVPADETAQVIDPGDLPEVLRSTTTTTTTSLPEEGAVTVTYYLIEQLDRPVLVPLVREAQSTVLVDVLTPMFDGSLQVEEPFINNLLEYQLASVSRPEGSEVATIDITTINVDSPPAQRVFRDAVAQLVWTLTEFSAIERVVILRDGELVPLPTNSTEEIGDVEAGTEVTRDFYDRYDPEQPAPTTTSTTTSPPPAESLPATSAPPPAESPPPG